MSGMVERVEYKVKWIN